MISGFIISLTATPDVKRFAWRRFRRIYPQYWLALAVAFLIDPAIPLAPDSTPAQHPLRLILLATAENDKVAVAWTLAYEVYFYVAVALLLLAFGRHWRRALAAWMALQTVLVAITASIDERSLYSVPLSPLILEFGLGCLLAHLHQRGRALPPALSVSAGLAWFAAGVWFNHASGHYAPLPRLFCFGPATALLLHGLVTLEQRRALLLPRVLVMLGDASYSLYLWHQMIFIVGAALLPGMPWLWAILALAFGLSQLDARISGRG